MGNDISTTSLTPTSTPKIMSDQIDLIELMGTSVTEKNSNPSVDQIKEVLQDLLVDSKRNTENDFLVSAPNSRRIFRVEITPNEVAPNVRVTPYDSENPARELPVLDLNPLLNSYLEAAGGKMEDVDPSDPVQSMTDKVQAEMAKLATIIQDTASPRKSETVQACEEMFETLKKLNEKKEKSESEQICEEMMETFKKLDDEIDMFDDKSDLAAFRQCVEKHRERCRQKILNGDTDMYVSTLRKGFSELKGLIPPEIHEKLFDIFPTAITQELFEEHLTSTKAEKAEKAEIPTIDEQDQILDGLDQLITEENKTIVSSMKLMVTVARAITEDVPNPSTEQVKATLQDTLVDIETDDENTFFVDVGDGQIYQITVTQGDTDTDIKLGIYDSENPEGSGEPPIDLNPMLDDLRKAAIAEDEMIIESLSPEDLTEAFETFMGVPKEDSLDSKLNELLAGLTFEESKRTLSVDDMAMEALSETLCEELEMDQIISPTDKVPRLIKDLGDRFLKGTPQHAICEPLGWTTLVNVAYTHWKSTLCTFFEAGKQYLTGNPIDSLHLPAEMSLEFKEIRATVDPEDLEATFNKIDLLLNQYYKTVLTNDGMTLCSFCPTHPDVPYGLGVFITSHGTMFVTPLLAV